MKVEEVSPVLLVTAIIVLLIGLSVGDSHYTAPRLHGRRRDSLTINRIDMPTFGYPTGFG